MRYLIKRRYFDFRTGNQTLSPLIQFSNFMMLAYLTISEVIPMWIFAPLFIVIVLVSFTYVGNRFRKHQTPTDLNMGYEKATEAATTVVQMMIPLELLLKKNNIPVPIELKERIKYMEKIARGKK